MKNLLWARKQSPQRYQGQQRKSGWPGHETSLSLQLQRANLCSRHAPLGSVPRNAGVTEEEVTQVTQEDREQYG